MARAVGIDLGTTNSRRRRSGGWRAHRHRQRRGRRGPRRPSSPSPRTARSWSARSPSGRPSPTSTAPSARSSATWAPTGPIDIDGKNYTPQQISRLRAAEAQARRRGLPRRAGHRRGHHRAGVLRRRPAPGHQGGRRDRRPRTCCASSTSRPRPRWPTASTRASEQTILVFDLGGGTFDVSLLEIGEGVVEVKATSGDNHLGGDDWDQRVVDWLVRSSRTATASTCPRTRWRMQRLREAAEKAKIELSSSAETTHQPALHHRQRRRPAAPRREADPRRVPAR